MNRNKKERRRQKKDRKMDIHTQSNILKYFSTYIDTEWENQIVRQRITIIETEIDILKCNSTTEFQLRLIWWRAHFSYFYSHNLFLCWATYSYSIQTFFYSSNYLSMKFGKLLSTILLIFLFFFLCQFLLLLLLLLLLLSHYFYLSIFSDFSLTLISFFGFSTISLFLTTYFIVLFPILHLLSY